MKEDKNKPKGKNARSNNQKEGGPPPGGPEVDKHFNNRSAESAEQGGQNEDVGEPAEGYGSVAPGIQGGGKR